jgi:predicted nucleic acid-binding protein
MDPPGGLILDACIGITFGNAGRIDLLTGLQTAQVVIGRRALSEIRKPPARDALRAAVDAGGILVKTIDLSDVREQAALARFDARRAFQGRGDAEVLALAACRGYIVASDERAIQRTALQEFGKQRVAGTLDILIWAVREERLTIDGADALLKVLDSGPGVAARLASRGATLEDLI